MPNILIRILLSLLWAGLGALGAWLSFLSLSKQAKAIQPDSDASLKQLPKLMAGRMLRLVLVGAAIYIALRIDSLYALVFVVALTLTTWLLIISLNRKSNRQSEISAMEQRR